MASSTPPPPPAGKVQIHGLDVLRFFAAALVMVYHFTYLPWIDPQLRGSATAAAFSVYRPMAPWIGTGWIGVQIFFVISGFVIAYTADGKSPLAFLNSRILRLVPGVWICATLSLPFLLLGGQPLRETVFQYAGSLVLSPVGPWVASAFWTLALEILFYGLVFALLCRGSMARIWQLTLLLGGVSTLVWAAYWGRGMLPRPLAELAFYLGDRRVPKLLLLQHGCFFAIGTTMWLVTRSGWSAARAAALALFVAAGLAEIVAETAKASLWGGYDSRAAVPVLLWLAALAALGLSVRFKAAIARVVGRRERTVRAIGLATYPVYLLHQPVGTLLVLALLGAGVAPAAALLVGCGVVVALALVVAMRLEPWLRHGFKRALATVERAMPPRLGWLVQPTRRLDAAPRPAG